MAATPDHVAALTEIHYSLCRSTCLAMTGLEYKEVMQGLKRRGCSDDKPQADYQACPLRKIPSKRHLHIDVVKCVFIETHSLTHGPEPFLRSRQLCSYSRASQHFMESRRFITVFTGARQLVPILSQTNPIQPIPSYLSKIHSNILHPPTFWSS
jgi:hypothetical protein